MAFIPSKSCPFPPEEFHNRFASIQREMEKAELDAVFLTTEANIHYYTGFVSQFWQSPTRPFFLILPRTGVYPTVVVPGCCKLGMDRTWIPETHIKDWAAPDPVDDGVSLVIEALEKLECKRFGRIGMPMGQETSVRMPLNDFFKLSAKFTFVDCTQQCRNVRYYKSELEAEKMYDVCGKVGRAFDDYPTRVKEELDTRISALLAGASGSKTQARDALSSERIDSQLVLKEMDMVCVFRVDALKKGCDGAPYVIGISGNKNGYPSIVDGPSEVLLSEKAGKTVFGIDTGCRVDNYSSDYTRNYEVEYVDQRTLREAVDEVSASKEGSGSVMDVAIRKHKEKKERIRSTGVDVDEKFRYTRIAHQNLFDATQLALEFIKEKRQSKATFRMCDVWEVMARHLNIISSDAEVEAEKKKNENESDIGRMGHGLGLELTEWPNMAPWDSTEIKPGMVLTLEPSVVVNHPDCSGPAKDDNPDIICHEENIYITEEGVELFSYRCPEKMQTLYLVSDVPCFDGNASDRSTVASHPDSSPHRSTCDTAATSTIGSLGAQSVERASFESSF